MGYCRTSNNFLSHFIKFILNLIRSTKIWHLNELSPWGRHVLSDVQRGLIYKLYTLIYKFRYANRDFCEFRIPGVPKRLHETKRSQLCHYSTDFKKRYII